MPARDVPQIGDVITRTSPLGCSVLHCPYRPVWSARPEFTYTLHSSGKPYISGRVLLLASRGVASQSNGAECQDSTAILGVAA
jgi:hypothetical protein